MSPGTPGPEQRPAEATQFVTPVSPPAEHADRTQAVSHQQPAQDRTQVVGSQGGNQVPNPEDTQIVSSQDRTQAVQWHATRPGDAERTQVVPGVPPQQHVGGYAPPMGHQQQQQHGGFGQYDDAISPPWAGSDFPPLAATGNPDWIRQGPEVFETEGKSSGGKIALIALAVVLVLGLGVGAYFMFFNKKSETPGPGPSTSAAAPTTTQRPKDDLEIADLPGSPEIAPEIAAFSDVETAKLLTEGELKAYQTATATKARLAVSKLGEGSQALVLTVLTGSPDLGATAVEALVQLQATYGMQPYTGTAPTGVKVTQIDASGTSPATIRGHYMHKKTLVRVQVYAPTMAEASKKFDDIMTTQLEELPADG